MRALTFSSMVLLAAACGGNWSNRDLDFANALPDRALLKSKLPASSTTTSPLSGVQTRHDGLSVGDPSNAYADTKKAKTDFNGVIDNVLGAVDAIRQYPPSARTTNARTWGPYADTHNPGFEFRLVITQTDDTSFAWSLDSHKTGEDFFSIVSGSFVPTMSLTRGQGAFVLHIKDFKSKIVVDPGLQALDEISVTYATDVFPSTVAMVFTFSSGNASGLSKIGYTSRALADASGALQFLISTPDNAQISSTKINASWLPSGAGKSVGSIQTGTLAGASQTECWNAAFLVTYFKQDWLGGMTSGVATDCVDVPGL